MSPEPHECQSCGLPIDQGRWCRHCVDAEGRLQDFETRFERMVQWSLRENPGLARAEAERQTLDYMARMPSWAGHPRVLAR